MKTLKKLSVVFLALIVFGICLPSSFACGETTAVFVYHKAKPATCTEGGYGEYWECDGNYYADSKGTVKLEGIPYTDPAGHRLSDWEYSGEGKHSRHCLRSGCDYSENGDCRGGTASCTDKAICTDCGAAYGTLAHEYALVASADGKHFGRCVKCGFETAETDCSYTEEKADKALLVNVNGKCTDKAVFYKACECGNHGSETYNSDVTLGDIGVGHDYGALADNVTTEPTSKAAGSVESHCSVCNESVELEIPALNDTDYTVTTYITAQYSSTSTYATAFKDGQWSAIGINEAATDGAKKYIFTETRSANWLGSYAYGVSSNAASAPGYSGTYPTPLSVWDIENWISGANGTPADGMRTLTGGALQFSPDTENRINGVGCMVLYDGSTSKPYSTSLLMRNRSGSATDPLSNGKRVDLEFMFRARTNNDKSLDKVEVKEFVIGLYGASAYVWKKSTNQRAPFILRYNGAAKKFEIYRSTSSTRTLTWEGDASKYDFFDYTKLSFGISKSADGNQWTVELRVNNELVPLRMTESNSSYAVASAEGYAIGKYSDAFSNGGNFSIYCGTSTTCALTIPSYVNRDGLQGGDKIYLYDEGNVPFDADGDTREFVFLTPYPAPVVEGQKNSAVIVMAGGGYNHISNSTDPEGDKNPDGKDYGRGVNNEGNQKEASAIAKWYNARGINVYVLNYRTAVTVLGTSVYREAMSDVLRAVRYLRYNADLLGINADKIAVQGGSAAGHLAAMALTCYDWNDNPEKYGYTPDENYVADEIDAVSAKPDAGVLAYPVITFENSTNAVHTGSRSKFLGSLSSSYYPVYSADKQVTSETSPAFIWAHKNDSSVNSKNTELMRDALDKNGVKNECHIFDDNGYKTHGIGAAFDDPNVVGESYVGKLKEAERWPVLATEFLKSLGF